MLGAALILFGLIAPLTQGDDPRADEVARQFEAEVRPVLAEHCVSCHSGDDPKAGLRLDSVEALGAGIDGEPLFEAGDPDASLLIEAVRYDDPFLAMPPSGKIPDEDIEALERWVAAGAHLPAEVSFDDADRLRWCFQPPVAPALELEEGQDPIDALLDARMEQEGVEASGPATPLAWLRRATFDLTGLPPTPEEVDAFLADGAPGARERVVDRLLASPDFGERWARRWLDLMRYAETKAHEFDYPILNAWQYRDYVVRAFDADVPYDRFVTELLAGDLVEEPRLDPEGRFDESPLGTGAWFLGEEVHSPVSPRGDQTDRVAHQVEVLSKAVLGLGVSCARCHDHKFDPISAVDYHALAGFAISTAPRQMRFETDGANRAIANEIRALEHRLRPRAAGAIAAALRDEAARAADIVSLHALAGAPEDGGLSAREAARRLQSALAEQGVGEHVTDVLLEDFETGELENGGLGPWTRTGEAFDPGPVVRATVEAKQAEMRPRGTYAVNSYAGHAGNGDRFVGTLTSAPFTASHDHLHLLVNGGDQEATRIELLDAESREVLGTVRGRRSNRYDWRHFDLTGLRGRSLRLRAVDEDSGAWGQIGLDHVILSSRRDAASAERSALTAAAWLRVLESDAWTSGAGWLAARSTGPVALRAALEDRAPAKGPAPAAEAPRVLVEYGELSGTRWIPNGPAFGPAPGSEGAIALALADEGLVVDSVATRPAAVSHSLWSELAVHPDSATVRGGSVNWVQAGRTLASPSFLVRTGRVAHLVRGEGKLITPISSHKMVAGPLHGASIRRFDTGGRWEWIVQDMPSAKGWYAHAEWSATGPSSLQVARTIELDDGAAPPALGGWEPTDLEEEGPGAHLSALLRDAAELLERGGIQGRVVGDEERAALLAVAEFASRRVQAVRTRLAAELAAEEAAFAALVERRQLTSRLAPAALDLEGRDEVVLDRGSYGSPGATAPRAAPRVLLAANAGPDAVDGEGSGRLGLARSLLGSESRLVQRVWVNRLWQAMFGKGIVGTPDDFGAMGAVPTHPALLDHLAISFEADGWSTKRMLRRMALTDAYGRTTEPTESARERDPKGELLAHARTRRIDAEEVRDALLAVSGELNNARFGPPVPIHLTAFMTGRGRPGSSGPLDGDRRRSIYLEVRRNFLHPFLTVFDMPTPSTCHGRRTSANVPAQALAMLNDPFVEGRAEALAELALESREGLHERATLVWRRALGRPPRPAELALVDRLAAEAGDERATLVDVAHAVLNTKEFLFLR